MLARLAAVALLDLVARRRRTRLSLGVLDETAHVLTASILVPDAEAAVLIGAVALDADHVPDLAGITLLRSRGRRPVTHSLAGLALLAAAAPRLGLSPSRAVLGASTHLLRDLGTGTTAVPLLWPLSRRGFALPYAVYWAVLASQPLLAHVPSARRWRPTRRRGRRSERPRTPAGGPAPGAPPG